ncbi:MAG: zinc-binding dehydrogenase [Candidatus Bathyarchaeia archaeon]
MVRMRAATICGSNMHRYRWSREALRKWREQVGRELIEGHEAGGVVEKVGEAVENVKVGDRVSVFHIFGCGHCEMCRKGYPMYCVTPSAAGVLNVTTDGAMADYLRVPSWPCLRLPGELSFIDGAVLSCAGLTAYQILTKLDLTARDTIAVYGLGPVGECAVLIAKAIGARVIGVDVVPERIVLAEKLGVDEPVNAAQMDPVERIRSVTARKRGADAAIDTTGNPEATRNALRSVKPLGKVGIVGVGAGMDQPVLPAGMIMGNGIWVTGTRVSNINLYFDLVNFMLDRKLSFDRIVTHRFPLEKAEEAFRLFDTLTTGKVAFTW